jgi:hypothetical protein
MASLAATASVAEDHSLCGPECSLVGLLPWQMDYVKPSFRIYDGCTDTAKRVSTAVPLKDGAVLQVYPEKRHFATLDDWRGSYPVAWETRRTLSYAERTVDVGHGPVLYNGKKEGVMAPLALEEDEEEDADAIDGGYADDERRVNGYVTETWEDDEDLTDEQRSEAPSATDAAAAAAESFAAICRALDQMGYAPPLTKVQMAIIRDALQSSA